MPRLLHTVACPLEPLPHGATFRRRDWPLHVTLLGNFEWEGGEDELTRRIADTVDGLAPISVVVGDEAMFGADRTVPVNLVVPHPDVTSLHHALIDERMTFAEPQFLRAGYRAHITHFPSGRRHEGDRVRLGQVVLAELDGSRAIVRSVWELGG